MGTTFLRNIWYYALPGHQLKPGKIVAKIFLNEPVLLGRTLEGTVFALRDFCPHQAVPLSAGCFDGNNIRCAFHGWTFDQAGQCVSIPALSEAQAFDTTRLKAGAYPVREVQGNIWIYMAAQSVRGGQSRGGGDIGDDISDVPQVPAFGDQTYQAAYTTRFSSDIDHAVIGLLDPAHIAFVHEAWWWRSPVTLQAVTKKFEPSFHGFTMQRHALEQQTFIYRLVGRDPKIEISFRLPGIRIEHISAAKHSVCSLTATTPISDTETETTTLLYATMPWFPVLKPLMLWFMRSFLAQDQKILSKQSSRLHYRPNTALIGDADVQARWYYRLKKEFAQATDEKRPFINPIQPKTLHWRS